MIRGIPAVRAHRERLAGEGPQGEQGEPGVGVPLPYGAEGSYLGIIDGIPQWNIPVGPGPEPIPEPNIVCTTLWDTYELRNAGNSPIEPPDKTEYLKTLDSWGNPNANTYEGASWLRDSGWDEITVRDTFTLTNSYSKVLTVSYEVYITADASITFPAPVPVCSSQYAQLISNTMEKVYLNSDQSSFCGGSASWLINREEPELSVDMTYVLRYCSNQQIFIRYFALEDPGTFALRRQMQIEEQFRALRGMTSGIDLSRPTQE